MTIRLMVGQADENTTKVITAGNITEMVDFVAVLAKMRAKQGAGGERGYSGEDAKKIIEMAEETAENLRMGLPLIDSSFDYREGVGVHTTNTKMSSFLNHLKENIDWLLLLAYHCKKVGWSLDQAYMFSVGVARFSCTWSFSKARIALLLRDCPPMKVMAQRFAKEGAL